MKKLLAIMLLFVAVAFTSCGTPEPTYDLNAKGTVEVGGLTLDLNINFTSEKGNTFEDVIGKWAAENNLQLAAPVTRSGPTDTYEGFEDLVNSYITRLQPIDAETTRANTPVYYDVTITGWVKWYVTIIVNQHFTNKPAPEPENSSPDEV